MDQEIIKLIIESKHIVAEDMPHMDGVCMIVVPAHIGLGDIHAAMHFLEEHVFSRADKKIIVVMDSLNASMGSVVDKDVLQKAMIKYTKPMLIKNIDLPMAETVAYNEIKKDKKFYDHFYDRRKKMGKKKK